jgi:hypothetical protein
MAHHARKPKRPVGTAEAAARVGVNPRTIQRADAALRDARHLLCAARLLGIYVALCEGLVAVKQERQTALAAHDHDQAAELLAEVIDLTYLVGEMATSLALARARFLSHDRPWPLGPVIVPDSVAPLLVADSA